MTTRQQALFMVDRGMVRIRRSQSRRTIGRFMQQRLDRHLNLAEVAVADALQELAEAGEQRPSIGQMAQRLGIEASRASRMTAAAVRAGLVRRIASQADGRSSHLELTPEGSKALEMIQRFRMKFFAQLMSEWSDQECAEFGRLLIRFTDLLPSGFSTEATEQKQRRPANPHQTRENALRHAIKSRTQRR
jgi:DNA-binding MarR family transcriptional regulator